MEAWREKREAYKAGELFPREARNFIKQDRESFLEREFKNSAVKYSDAVKVYDLANDQEKAILGRLLREREAAKPDPATQKSPRGPARVHQVSDKAITNRARPKSIHSRDAGGRCRIDQSL
jgi:hypothetical protein